MHFGERWSLTTCTERSKFCGPKTYSNEDLYETAPRIRNARTGSALPDRGGPAQPPLTQWSRSDVMYAIYITIFMAMLHVLVRSPAVGVWQRLAVKFLEKLGNKLQNTIYPTTRILH